jgi:nucleolin
VSVSGLHQTFDILQGFPLVAKYQLICVGNAERMSTLSKPNAQTIKALAVDAFQRNCVLSAVHNNNGYQQKRLNREMHDDRNTKRARQGEHDDRNTKRARPGEPGASLKHQMDNSARVHQSNTAIHVSTTNGKARLPPDDNSNEYDRGPNGKSGSQHPKDSAALQESDGRAEKARGPTSDSMKPAASRRKTVALCSSSQSSSSSESSSLSDSSSDSSTSDDSPDDESVKPDDESVKVNSLLGSKPNMTSSTPPITAERVKTEVIAVDDTSEGNVEKNPASSNLEQDDMMEDFGLENSQMNSQPEEVEQDSTSPQHFDGNSTMSNADKQQDSAFEPGRPEMPLDMKSSMVMSYDSDSCGDNRSEVDSESDEEGKTESRTNMVLGTSGFTNETSVAADCYDIDI